MNKILIHDELRGDVTMTTESRIGSGLLSVIACSRKLTGSIEGTVENEKCYQQYHVTYKNGVRTRFKVGLFVKER